MSWMALGDIPLHLPEQSPVLRTLNFSPALRGWKRVDVEGIILSWCSAKELLWKISIFRKERKEKKKPQISHCCFIEADSQALRVHRLGNWALRSCSRNASFPLEKVCCSNSWCRSCEISPWRDGNGDSSARKKSWLCPSRHALGFLGVGLCTHCYYL